jgi:hypothetical protein
MIVTEHPRARRAREDAILFVDNIKELFRRHGARRSPQVVHSDAVSSIPSRDSPLNGNTTSAPRRLLRATPLCLRLYLPVALLLTSVYWFGQAGWYRTAAAGNPEFGVNFSCKQTEYLGLACEPAFVRILDDLGVRHIRISAYWSDIERRPGEYDFRSVDRLLDIARSRDALVTVSIGMRAQRYPEFWFPTWLRREAGLSPEELPEDNPIVRSALLAYLKVAAEHIGAHPAVEAIQVENEPFVPSYAYETGWQIRPEFLAEEIALVRANDPGGHPIVVSHASWTRLDDHWRWILDRADVIAQSVYVKRQRGPWHWFYIFPYRLGPLTADLRGQADEAKRRGKSLWVGELQAEPFESPTIDVRRISTDRAASFSVRRFDANVELAARSGATRVYLWGAEWWLYLHDARGEPELWTKARQLFRGNSTEDGTADGRSR